MNHSNTGRNSQETSRDARDRSTDWNSFSMRYRAIRTADGTIHVQNLANGLTGQHHVHSQESFNKWCREIDQEIRVGEGKCNCGLTKSGYVKEYDFEVWYDSRYE